MHFSTAYYLMLLYIAVMFKPVIPVVMDAYDHAFHECIHLATVHEKYGSNHLDKALANAGSDNENGKSQKSISTEDPVPVHITSGEVSFALSASDTTIQWAGGKFCTLPSVFLSRLSPPPKFS